MASVAVVDLGRTNIKYGLADTRTDRLVFRAEAPTRAREGARTALARVAALLSPLEFSGLGLCSGGQIDSKSGKVLFASANMPGYTGMEVKDFLRGAFPVPVAVMNDGHAAALGEAAFGAARGFSDFLCLTFGTGVGGAIVTGGRLYEGSGGAGEFGHVVTHRGGLPCFCGGRGCYECYASASALTRSASERFGRPVGGRELFDLLRQGRAEARAVILDWLEEVALGLAGFIHILGPEAVVLGGGILREPFLWEHLPALVRENSMPGSRGTKLLPAALGSTAGMLGMYSLVKEML